MQDRVISCAANHKVGRGLSLKTGEVFQFSATETQVGFGDAVVLGKLGTYDFLEKKVSQKDRIVEDLVSPPVSMGNNVAYLGEEFVALRIGRQSFTHKANPNGWYPPALSNKWVGWVENDQIYVWNPMTGDPSVNIGNGRHIQGNATGFFWYTDTHIHFWSPHTEEKWRIKAKVVDRLGVFEDRVCWSQWGDKDIDIHCSDGFVLQRKGNQLWPSIYKDWLLFQENGKPMVYALKDS